MTKVGSQKSIYLRNEEWLEVRQLAKLHGFRSSIGFIVYLVRQFICGKLAFTIEKK